MTTRSPDVEVRFAILAAFALCLASACAPSPDDTASGSGAGAGDGGDDTGGGGSGDSGSGSGDTDQPPLLTAEEASQSFVDMASQGFPTPAAVWTEMDALLAQGDADCPGEGTWFRLEQEGCVASSGYLFRGELYAANEFVEGETSTEYSLDASLIKLTIQSPEGEELRVAGHWKQNGQEGTTAPTVVNMDFVGSVSFPPSERPWLSQTTSISGSATYNRTKQGEDWVWSVGGLCRLGWGERAYRLDELNFSPTDCETFPRSGALEVWVEGGAWARAEFSGDCDCPTWIDAYGNDLGESCIDLSPAFEAMAADLGEFP